MVSGTFRDRYAGRTVLPPRSRDVKPLFPSVIKRPQREPRAGRGRLSATSPARNRLPGRPPGVNRLLSVERLDDFRQQELDPCRYRPARVASLHESKPFLDGAIADFAVQQRNVFRVGLHPGREELRRQQVLRRRHLHQQAGSLAAQSTSGNKDTPGSERGGDS
jgi:hypothetical protein